jgi:ubiquinone/menaquinone biosynthesis C-methylase UbiE
VGRLRRSYYDTFSRFYDRFVALHSRDEAGLVRKFLADLLPVRDGSSVLDVCTGTATLLPHMQERVGLDGRVIGMDFSRGMLKVAKAKTASFPTIHLVEGDVGCLPFAAESFDAVTCSHAFYELKGELRESALQEIRRILRPSGAFLMMEHDVPANRVVKALFYLRLTIVGAGNAIAFLRRERDILEARFATVEKVVAPGGRSKVMVCWK